MRTVRLNGQLGKKYGRVHKLDVRTPAEAVRALCANFPEFEKDVIESTERGVGYKCVVDKAQIGEDHLHYPMSRSFSITPVVAGAGKTLGIILGVALIAAAVFMPAFVPVFSIAGTTFGFGAAATLTLGVALTLGGIAQLLAPTPKAGTQAERNENPMFNGPVNTSQQGLPVPLGYGRMIVGSAVISAGVTVEQSGSYDNPYDYYFGGYGVPY